MPCLDDGGAQSAKRPVWTRRPLKFNPGHFSPSSPRAVGPCGTRSSTATGSPSSMPLSREVTVDLQRDSLYA